MFWLLPSLALLGVLAVPAGTSRTCPACSSLFKCKDITCPSEQDSCLFGQLQLGNGTVLENGSCVAPGGCREGFYELTYGLHSGVRISTACCDNCSVVTSPQPEAEPNGVKCHYCSGNNSASCDSHSVMNCTGTQTACIALNGTWSTGGPQILKGCATPEVCHLGVNDTLGPEGSGFRLTARPECSFLAPPTQLSPHTVVTHTSAKTTICFTCSDPNHCDPLPCPEDRSFCLQTTGFAALGEGNSTSWRNGSCVASKDCQPGSSISALTYSAGFGFWINTACCRGNCQEPTPLHALPPAQLASRALSNFLCPACPEGQPGPCNSSFYMQCPRGEMECVQLHLVPKEGGQNVTLRGCGSPDLCSPLAVTQRHLQLPGYRLAQRLDCSVRQRAVLESQCHSGAAPGLRLALPLLVVALGTAALS